MRQLATLHIPIPAFTDREKRIHNFLAEQRVGVLSSVTPGNNPHGSVVYYTIGEHDFTIHILTKTGTRKYENIAHNDHVMLTVFEPRTQTTAQVTGIAAERGGSNNVNRVSAAVFGASAQTSNEGLPPIVKLQAGTFTTLQIEPVQIRMAVYAQPDSGDYGDLFESIESFELREGP